MQEKRLLRAQILKKRNKLSSADAVRWSDELTARLAADPRVHAARHIAVYLSMAKEVQTGALIQWARTRDIKVSIPYHTDGDTYRFCFYEVNTVMAKGPHRIPQPADPRDIADCSPDIIITPAVACDSNGRRLGFGGGSYDMLLERYDTAWRVAPLFDCQWVNQIPVEEHDQPVDTLVFPGREVETGARFSAMNTNNEMKGMKP